MSLLKMKRGVDPDIVLLQDWMTTNVGVQPITENIPTARFDSNGPLNVSGTKWSGTPYIKLSDIGNARYADGLSPLAIQYEIANKLSLLNEFTIEFWTKQDALGYADSYNVPEYMTFMNESSKVFSIGSFKNAISIYGRELESNSIRTDTTNWHHIVLTKTISKSYLFIDGILNQTVNKTLSNEASVFRIEPRYWTLFGSYYYYRNLSIAQLCITKRAKWTENFTPPTKPYYLGI